jgi:hypothetical protein
LLVDKISAGELPLHKVFCSDFDFRIPNYQRPYAWKAEQASQLLADLTDALDRGSDEPYFLGSVVLVQAAGSSAAEVIDGQQRLTTLTILLAILRDLTDSADLALELEKMIREPGAIIGSRPARPRISLRDRDAAFFEEHVQSPQSIPGLLGMLPDALESDAQRAVHVNAAALHEVLQSWTEERRLALAQMLGERTILVVVSTPDQASAHRIFSVMNARGLDLSPADIFKATVIGDLDADLGEKYAEKWESAEDALGRDDFADLFLHIRMVFAKERARVELLREFPRQVLSSYLPGNATGFVDGVLVPYADAYEQIRDSSYMSHAGAEKVNAWFRRLRQLDNNDWRPPALWALRRHHDDPAWLDSFFRSLERLAASMLIRRVYATPRASRYADLLRQLDGGAGLDADALDLSDSDRAETIRQLDGEIYLAAGVRKYVLLRLDEVLAGNPGVTYDHPLITVEHVLPQHPRGDSAWTADFTPDQLVLWTHRIANLVLLNRRKNAEAQNFDFARKKAAYFVSSTGVAAFALTTQVISSASWTPEVLQYRQENILSRLSAEWAL